MKARLLCAGALVLCSGVLAQAAQSEAQQNAPALSEGGARAVNKWPRKTIITPSTRDVGQAYYYTKFRRLIEERGTIEFPQSNGIKLYGSLVLSIPVSADGQIYGNEGGIRVERSSGITSLDDAAIRIVQRSAPFEKLPEKMLSSEGDDVWVLIASFNFTKEEMQK